MERDYQPQVIEPEVQKHWESEQTFKHQKIRKNLNSIVSACFPTLRAKLIWVTSETTPLAM